MPLYAMTAYPLKPASITSRNGWQCLESLRSSNSNRPQFLTPDKFHKRCRRIDYDVNTLSKKIGESRHPALVRYMLEFDFGFKCKQLHRQMHERADASGPVK